MNNAVNDWNNRVRAGWAARAIAAFNEAKGESHEPDQDDITDLISDLIHLKMLISQESPEEMVEFALSVALADKECEHPLPLMKWKEWPKADRDLLIAWSKTEDGFTRELAD